MLIIWQAFRAGFGSIPELLKLENLDVLNDYFICAKEQNLKDNAN